MKTNRGVSEKMKLLHEYEDGNYIWVYPEPEFTLDKLQQYKDDFEKHPRPLQRVLLVDDDYNVKARIALVLNSKHGIRRIVYENGTVFTRNRDGYLTLDRRQLLLEAIEAILRGHEKRLKNLERK